MIRWNDFEFHSDLGAILSEVTIESKTNFKSVSKGERSAIKDDDRESLNQETRQGKELARMAGGRTNLENSTNEGCKEATALDRSSLLQSRGV
jgi:hypothetical protein